MKPDAVMIFAAGFGTRMRPLTADRPKPIIPVGGRPLIDHARTIADGAGARRIVANLHYLPEILEAHLDGTGVTTIREAPEILDTGGGLRHALPLLGQGPVWTLNPDAIFRGPNPLTHLKRAWQPERMDALLLCIEPERALGTETRGDFSIDADGRIARGPGVIYGGAQIARTDRLAEIPSRAFSLNSYWDLLMADARCFGVIYPGRWCDVGHPGGIPLAESLLEETGDA